MHFWNSAIFLFHPPLWTRVYRSSSGGNATPYFSVSNYWIFNSSERKYYPHLCDGFQISVCIIFACINIQTLSSCSASCPSCPSRAFRVCFWCFVSFLFTIFWCLLIYYCPSPGLSVCFDCQFFGRFSWYLQSLLIIHSNKVIYFLLWTLIASTT